jgi:hypothetical protein
MAIYTAFLGVFSMEAPLLCLVLQGLRVMRVEMSPEPPHPGVPEKSGGIFREVIPGSVRTCLAGGLLGIFIRKII